MFFTFLADLINKLMLLTARPSASIQSAPSSEVVDTPTAPTGAAQPVLGRRALITIPEVVSAHFYDSGSAAWAHQSGMAENGKMYHGIHFGNDFSAPVGSAVYAPFAMSIIARGHYSDSGRLGDYVIGTLDNGIQYYSGHLDNVNVSVGEHIDAGTQLGKTNIYNHTHVQMKRGDVFLDPQEHL